ncbi:MAG: glycosyltransferase family 4 protein [Spirochaetales bacterium]|nr:glycosyltransferase family 4 protein [Spirochaetales bacterium]
MKLLMLNSEYPPLGGGQGNANKAMLKEFAKTDIQVDLITASSGKKHKEINGKIRLFFLNIGKNEKNFLFQSSKELITYSVKSWRFAAKLIKQSISKKAKYDAIIAWSGVPAGFIAMTLSFIFRIPYIVLLRGADVPFYDKRWAKLDKFVFRFLSPYIWKNSLLTIANSQSLRELAYKTSRKKKIDLIYNGIDLERYTNKSDIKISPKQIIAVGRLSKIKGFDLLIQAVAAIKTPCQLVIAGDGPEKENLENLAKMLGIEKKVILLGRLEKEQLISFYQESSIFCMSSYNEGMSNAMLEAIACGLPVVTTQVGGAAELVKGNGVIVPCGDSFAIQEALETLLDNPERMAQCQKQSLQIASEFSWDIVTNSFIDLLNKSLKKQ